MAGGFGRSGRKLGDYQEIDGMSSDDFFEVMADFTEEVDNPFVRERLINALRMSVRTFICGGLEFSRYNNPASV